ncbi:hypothetical protein AN958_02302 [Leucoagaricus sp. SymC.cos]|nr:hypothetical protein AN958_02302 [Leucoagaricus sp. SymC.cos]
MILLILLTSGVRTTRGLTTTPEQALAPLTNQWQNVVIQDSASGGPRPESWTEAAITEY